MTVATAPGSQKQPMVEVVVVVVSKLVVEVVLVIVVVVVVEVVVVEVVVVEVVVTVVVYVVVVDVVVVVVVVVVVRVVVVTVVDVEVVVEAVVVVAVEVVDGASVSLTVDVVVVTVVVGHGTLVHGQPLKLHFSWMNCPWPHSGSHGQDSLLHWVTGPEKPINAAYSLSKVSQFVEVQNLLQAVQSTDCGAGVVVVYPALTHSRKSSMHFLTIVSASVLSSVCSSVNKSFSISHFCISEAFRRFCACWRKSTRSCSFSHDMSVSL